MIASLYQVTFGRRFMSPSQRNDARQSRAIVQLCLDDLWGQGMSAFELAHLLQNLKTPVAASHQRRLQFSHIISSGVILSAGDRLLVAGVEGPLFPYQPPDLQDLVMPLRISADFSS